MLTEKQIEDQQEFERKQISGGLLRLRSLKKIKSINVYILNRKGI